jgi:hypothetical protein
VGEYLSTDDAPATASFTRTSDQAVTFPWIYGGAVNWYTPVEGLRLGASGMQGRYNFQGQLHYDVLIDRVDGITDYVPFIVDIDQTQEIKHIVVVGAEYLTDRWSLSSELYHDSMGSNTTLGWYGQLGWQATERLALGAYYSELQNDEDDVVELGVPSYYAWQNDLALSLRIDLTDHWIFKIENHTIDGVASARHESLKVEQVTPLERRWAMFTAKTTFHF